MTSRENMIQKVRKLLALADDNSGGSDAERQLAMERAQALIFEHELSMFEVNPQAQGIGVVEQVRTGGMGDRWKLQLWAFVSMGLGLRAVQSGEGKTVLRMHVIGPRDRVEFSELLTDWLAPQLITQATAAYVKAPQVPSAKSSTGWARPSAKAFKREFLTAAGGVVRERLAEAEARQQEASGRYGMELVLSYRTAMDRYMEQHYPRLRKQRSSGQRHDGAREAGALAGARADLSPGNKVGRGGDSEQLPTGAR